MEKQTKKGKLVEKEQWICKLCYREFDDGEMARNVSGAVTDYCRTCNSIVGKGPGYASAVSDEEAEEWFKDASERKAKLIRENKLTN